jgi:hypothetical protein
MSIIWKDALEFEDYGGFRAETQFVQEMGQAYLFACRVPGVPVEPAKGKFKLTEGGMYRIWVRTKNWRQPEAPGRLRAVIDGVKLPVELGKAPIDSWYFEIAGDIRLEPGEHSIEIEDTTGYFGRFSSVIITDDMDFMPEKQVERMWKQRASIKGLQLVTINEEEYDVIVAGAGPAGIPAAIAAARYGMKVALLHSRPGLGGNASDEATVGFDGAYTAHPNMREGGIAEEIRRIRDHEEISWEASLTRLIEAEPNIKVFRNEFVIDAETENGYIKSVKTLNCITQTFTVFSAKMYIDCTGDGWLGYYSGALYRIGREAKWQYNEASAPEVADCDTMSGCLMGGADPTRQLIGYYAEISDEDSAFTAPSWAIHLPEGENLYRNPGRLHTGEWWIENPTNFDDLWEQEKVRDELLRLNLGYFHWLKNSYSRRDVARKYKITDFGRYNAKRETRRLMGDYVLTQNDCDGRTFDDAISYCGWPLDIHHPKGIYSGKEGPFYSNHRVPVTGIPYRCIYSKNIRNLMMAGRCASVSHLALGTVRVENTLATLGQAAGTACAICVKDGIEPRDIYINRMQEFQQILLKDDLTIPGCKNTDPNDKALSAKVSASSVSRVEPYITERGAEGDFEELTSDTAAAFALKKPIEYVKVMIRNANADDTTLKASLFSTRSTNGYESMTVLDSTVVTVPAGFEGWFELPLKASLTSGGAGVILDAAKGVYWKRMLCTSFRMTSAKRLNAYRWDIDTTDSFIFKMYDETYELCNCAPENVINGYSRIMNPNEYAWVSDPAESLPQWIRLDFEKPTEVSNVKIIFDTNLTTPALSSPRLKIVKQTVSDYNISLIKDGNEIIVAGGKDNFMRRVDHTFSPTIADAVKITVTGTCGDPSARIFEVRIY